MNVLVIDDHPLLLTEMCQLGQQMGHGNEVVIASNAQAARDAWTRSKFDLALLALERDIEVGLGLLQELRSAHPALPVVVVAPAGRRDLMLRSVEMGAIGFVPYGACRDNLLSSLVVVLSVKSFLPVQATAQPALSATLPSDAATPVGNAATSERAAAAIDSLALTPRQKEVLALMFRGQSNKLIARELNLSVDTIKDHVTGVLRSLKVDSRTEAAAAVSRLARFGPVRTLNPSLPSTLVAQAS